MKKILSADTLNNIIESTPLVLCFFNSNKFWGSSDLLCKAEKMLLKYPEVSSVYVDLDESPEIGAAYSIFICPTILLFTEGKESIRESKFIVLSELEKNINRYSFLLS